VLTTTTKNVGWWSCTHLKTSESLLVAQFDFMEGERKRKGIYRISKFWMVLDKNEPVIDWKQTKH